MANSCLEGSPEAAIKNGATTAAGAAAEEDSSPKGVFCSKGKGVDLYDAAKAASRAVKAEGASPAEQLIVRDAASNDAGVRQEAQLQRQEQRQQQTEATAAAALKDYISRHRRRYEDRLQKEIEEEEKAKCFGQNLNAPKNQSAQQEAKRAAATRLAADEELSRQLFAQLNQHLLTQGFPATPAEAEGAGVRASRGDYTEEWRQQLLRQHQEEQQLRQHHAVYAGEADTDPVRPPMRTNYSERLIDDAASTLMTSSRMYSERLLRSEAREGERHGRSPLGHHLSLNLLGLQEGFQLSEESSADRARRRRRAVYAMLVCVFMMAPLIIAIFLVFS